MDDLTLKIHNYNSMVFDAIFQPKQDRREIIAPSSVLKVERRLYDDSFAFADRATWLDAHQITQDRRRRNIITENNSSLIPVELAAGYGVCNGEVE